MNVCLLLQRRFAYIGHFIAAHLHEKYRVDNFCAYVYRRQGLTFLTNQLDVRYSSLLLDEGLHAEYQKEKLDPQYLQWLEKEFGIPNLWPYIEIDRIIRLNQFVREYPYNKTSFTHEEMMRLIQVRARAIVAMLEKEKPEVLICSVVGGMGALLLYHIAKKKNVKVFVIIPSRLGNTYVISEHFSLFTGVEKRFAQLLRECSSSPRTEDAAAYIEEFRARPKSVSENLQFYLDRTSRLKQMDFLTPKNLTRYYRWLVGSIHEVLFSEERHDYSFVKPWNKFRDQIMRKLRSLRGISDMYDEIDPSEDFAFFPLHMEPEISTMLYAPYFTDQLHVIKQSARSLPLRFKLYVKEQPSMVEYRKRSFYKELKKIPNVKLIRPNVSSFTLINHAKLVLTITGTAGWEAALMNKPVITFGEPFYNALPSVGHCTDYTQLPQLIQKKLEHPGHDENQLTQLVASILEEAVDVNMHQLWEREPDLEKKREGIRPLADALAKKMGLAPK